MSDELMDTIYNRIENEFFLDELYLDSTLFKEIVREEWTKASSELKISKTFEDSRKWIRNFQTKFNIVSRTQHSKRRQSPDLIRIEISYVV
jgi:hypothetical protein